MHDYFIGTDIVSVKRIKKTVESKHGDKFLQRVYSEKEINYCNSKSQPSIHFAGRFAAKEAVKKALLTCFPDQIFPMEGIEILADQHGAPIVKLDFPNLDDWICKVSISHTDSNAIAFALMEKNDVYS